MATPESSLAIGVRGVLLTARSPGAIATIAVQGEAPALSKTLRSLCGGSAPPAEGGVSLRAFGEIDEGLVVRLRADLAWIMPHGGVRIVERLASALEDLGVAWVDRFDDQRDAFPEAADAIEAAMLSALAESASPLAIPQLLDQPRRWRAHAALGDSAGAFTDEDHARWRRLDRLIDPPTVCVVGPPNAGKSTLLNTLAGREVAIASPVAGTTRDFVSTRLDLAGLVVEWLDLPGLSESTAGHGATDGRDDVTSVSIEAAAVEAACRMLVHADLVVLLAAPDQTWADLPQACSAPSLRVMSKSDLPQAATSPRSREADLAISAATGHGVADLVCAVRDALVPPGDLAHPGPWRQRTSRAGAPYRGR